MAGIILVTKPSFIFPDDENVSLKETWIRTNTSNELRKMYQDGKFFIFELRSKLLTTLYCNDYGLDSWSNILL